MVSVANRAGLESKYSWCGQEWCDLGRDSRGQGQGHTMVTAQLLVGCPPGVPWRQPGPPGPSLAEAQDRAALAQENVLPGVGGWVVASP